jgi:hypothetical protein
MIAKARILIIAERQSAGTAALEPESDKNAVRRLPDAACSDSSIPLFTVEELIRQLQKLPPECAKQQVVVSVGFVDLNIKGLLYWNGEKKEGETFTVRVEARTECDRQGICSQSSPSRNDPHEVWNPNAPTVRETSGANPHPGRTSLGSVPTHLVQNVRPHSRRVNLEELRKYVESRYPSSDVVGGSSNSTERRARAPLPARAVVAHRVNG